MKALSTLLLALLITVNLFAQSPQKLSYQAVVRDNSNKLVASKPIGMRVSILQTSATGTAVYVETQTPTSNANGLVSIEIGSGTKVSGDFTTIDWATGPYYIKTEIDVAGGTTYSITATSQLLSVPYALYAASSGTSDNISGDVNKVLKMTSSEKAGSSQISDDGTNVNVGFSTAPSIGTYKLASNGNLSIVNGQLGLYNSSNAFQGYLNSPSNGSLQLGLAAGASGNISFYNSGSRLSIFNSGKVAIGESAPSNAKFEVQGTGSMGSALGLKNTGTGNEWTFSSQDDGKLKIRKEGASGLEVMTISPNGAIGINNGTPGAKLDINGSIKVGESGDIVWEIKQITGTTASSGYYTIITLPTGYTMSNTRVISAEINYNGTGWVGLSGTSSNTETEKVYYYLTDNTIWVYYQNISAFVNKSYRIVLMKL